MPTPTLNQRNPTGTKGSAAIASIAVIAAAALAITLALAVGNVVVSKAHARGVADITALAAATEWNYYGHRAPCDIARQIAARNHAAIKACEIHGSSIQVTVAVSTRAGFSNTEATARAGPAETLPRAEP